VWRKWFIGLRFDFVCAIHSRARDVASKKKSKIKLNVAKIANKTPQKRKMPFCIFKMEKK